MEMETGASALIGSGLSLLILLVFTLTLVILYILCFWQILKKAGYPPALSLLLLIPGLGQLAAVILLFVLAFGKWPIYEKLSHSSINKPE